MFTALPGRFFDSLFLPGESWSADPWSIIWEIVAKPAMINGDVIDEVSRVLQIPRQEAAAVVG